MGKKSIAAWFKGIVGHGGGNAAEDAAEREERAAKKRAREFNRSRREHAVDPHALTSEDFFAIGDREPFASEADRQKAFDCIFKRPPVNGFTPADPRDIFPMIASPVAPDNPTLRHAARADGNGAPTLDADVGGPRPPMTAAANARAVHAGATSNPVNSFGFDPIRKYGIDDRVLKHYMSRAFITWNSCAVIAGHELISDACSIPADDAMAHGYRVVCSSAMHHAGWRHESSEIDFLRRVRVAADRMGIDELAIRLATKTAIFGVGIAIPVMVVTDEDGNEIEDETGAPAKFDYSQEYDPDRITRNSYRGFAVVEPQWLTYEFDPESSSDPTSLHFYEPTYYVKADGTKIHRSWVIRIVYKEVADILKPTYYFGGLSLTQMMYERMWCADKIANEAPLLAMTKRLLIADGNMEQLIAEPKKSNLFFRAINYFRDNFSIFVKRPGAQIQQIDTSLSDLTPVTMAQYQLAAAIAQIPVTKFLKNVPSGLQATGQYEWDDYAQKLIGIQEKWLRPFLERHFELYCRSNYWTEDGQQRRDLELTVEFAPIDLPKADDQTRLACSQIQAAATAVQNGILTVAEARAFLRKTGNSLYDGVTPQVPEILQKIEDAKDPAAQQQGGMPGMPGGMPGMPGAGGGDPNDPNAAAAQQDPSQAEVQANAGIFEQALNEIKQKKGDQNAAGLADQPAEGQPPTDQPSQTEAQSEAQGEEPAAADAPKTEPPSNLPPIKPVSPPDGTPDGETPNEKGAEPTDAEKGAFASALQALRDEKRNAAQKGE